MKREERNNQVKRKEMGKMKVERRIGRRKQWQRRQQNGNRNERK